MDATQRASCRTQLTKLCNAINEFLINLRLTSELEANESEQELIIFQRRLQNAHSNLKRADEAVRSSVKEEDFQRDFDSVLEYDDRAVSMLAQLECKINNCKRLGTTVVQPLSVEADQGTSACHGVIGGIAGALSSTALITLDAAAHEKEENGGQSDELRILLDFLKNEIEALEKSQILENKANDRTERDKKSKPAIATATSLLANSQQRNSNSCVLCGKNNHATKDCRDKLTIEQKKLILRKEGRCFRCANLSHSSKFCKAQWVKCKECGGRHITIMCERNRSSTNQRDSNSETNAEAAAMNTNTASFNTIEILDNSETYLQTAHSIISDSGQKREVCSRIIMDNGSQNTYISETLCSQLALQTIKYENLKIYGIGERSSKKAEKYRRVKLMLKSQYSEEIICISAVVVPTICINLVPTIKLTNKNLVQLNHRLADSEHNCKKLLSGINVLIGQDNYWKFTTFECKRLAENLAAINTFFGWTIQGRLSSDSEDISLNEDFVLNSLAEAETPFDVAKFWTLESIGITNTQANSEQEIMQKVVSQIENRDNRYTIRLPWRHMNETLNDNKRMALARLNGLTAKLLKNEDKLIEYDCEIRDLCRNGIAEAVVTEQSNTPIYYMPHRPVYRDEKSTTRMRIVFDASSSEPGFTSLNEHLSAGNNLIADLLATLLRFRSNKIAIIADIKKAFLQISLDESDRDSHRFLWYDSVPKPDEEPPRIKCFRMTRVTFGVTSSPYLLAATIQKHLENCKPDHGNICDKLKTSFYVDDLVLSEENLETAKYVCQRTYEIMKSANFVLRKWNSNDRELRKTFPKDDVERKPMVKVLGIKWCTISDKISVDVEEILPHIKSLRGTKRNVLKAMAKIYDPLGMLGPFTMRIKLLLQHLWKLNIDWDRNIEGELLSEFQNWQEELGMLKTFSIERCFSPLDQVINELHIFSDASPKAYGAVAYIRNNSPDGRVATTFLCSKNRVAPINKNSENELTIPKLELTAALIAAKLSGFIKKSVAIEIKSTYLWTDSVICLSWILGQTKKIKPYITARVSEINKLTNIYEWRHCEGKTNPADSLTRGLSAKALLQSRLWLAGPSWLRDDNESWSSKFSNKECLNVIAEPANQRQTVFEEAVCKIEDFSRKRRLLHVTAFIFRFVNNVRLKNRAMQRNHENVAIGKIDELSAAELEAAELYWIKYTQRRHYKDEIKQLKKSNQVARDSKIRLLNPVLIEGVLRLNSRFATEEFGDAFANPIILPKFSHFSLLLIREVHLDTHHSGINSMLAHIRTKYWIVQGRQLIKRMLRSCITCKRLHGKSASEGWTVLPLERVKTSRPFEKTGVDFAGPLYVKNETSQTERKVYIMLFTCAAIRAVHLEMVDNLTSKSCIDAVRRFIARRGVPATIISDNAKTFKRVDLELRKLEEIVIDIVLIHEDNKSRLLWKMGIIHRVYPGRDGHTRACDVRIKDQQLLRRPIQLLYPLEVSASLAEAEGVKI